MTLRKYHVVKITAKMATEIVKKYHYSGKTVSNSKLHLGIVCENDLVGCLSYGPPMNGTKTSDKILPGVDMYELNRMVMDDTEPRNSESRAIAACNDWLRKNTNVQYLLSFSDGKEGNVGYIYQATNWTYIGYLLSDSFYDLDGKILHSVTVWHKFKEDHHLRDTHTTHEILCKSFQTVSRITSKQHVYLLPLYKKVKFPFATKPYPKKDKEVPILRRVVYKDSEGVYLPSGIPINYTEEKLESVF